jgi:hypothetical protein
VTKRIISGSVRNRTSFIKPAASKYRNWTTPAPKLKEQTRSIPEIFAKKKIWQFPRCLYRELHESTYWAALFYESRCYFNTPTYGKDKPKPEISNRACSLISAQRQSSLASPHHSQIPISKPAAVDNAFTYILPVPCNYGGPSSVTALRKAEA